ncbi:hypothetical protein RUM43_004634 [Polyplax serrata]|uniref:Uncharacterized protein n=1 Tax=Polyplax serrata TaxID=468196 RepID=A0AAN8SBW0_POLSC
MRIELLCLALVIACVGAEITGYTTRYDHINLDDILYNNRLLKNYYNCMVGAGRCTADATKLKLYFPDALNTKCSKCTPVQKKKVKRTVEFLMKYKPEMWEGLVKKYDPTGELTKNILTDPAFLGNV